MGKRDKKNYQVCAIYDTETTTLGRGNASRAFAYAYIFNDLREASLLDYEPETSDDIRIYRTTPEALRYLDGLVAWGERHSTVPVVAAYNLMFDLQTLLAALGEKYGMTCIAQTSTHVYTLSLVSRETGEELLRFWDTFFLDMGGLRSMGRTAGLPKAVGDLDYSLTRTAETPLTDRETYYMRRDVQVIPAYLRWMLSANDWMEPGMFGVRVITKTGVARQMALHTIYKTVVPGKNYNLGRCFEALCEQELPPDFQTMALRTACFRGGLTFTAARTASTVVTRVGSWDVTSMHHQYLNGRRLPVKFHKAEPQQLRMIAASVIATPRERVLAHYEDPFGVNLNGMFEFRNLRLREGSAFEFYGIALLAEGKFHNKTTIDEGSLDAKPGNAANFDAENAIKSRGWIDVAKGATFAFGKLYRADYAQVCLTEVELWNVAQVYEWDSFDAIGGEITAKTVLPPDYVSIQSNVLFDQKSDVKRIMNNYTPGEPYPLDVPPSIPENIAKALKAGELDATFMKAYYNVQTKGVFNSLYGTQAMQLWRPDFMVEPTGEIHTDSTTVPTPENFEERAPKTPRVLYTYGTRIVAGSRQHLVIAIQLIFEAFGERALITGGDTDSLKISLAAGIEPEDVTAALEPLHAACRDAKAKAQRRIRRNYPDKASDLDQIGEFDFEPASKTSPLYERHLELWNKARVSYVDGHTHVTFAGMSRPERPEGFAGEAYNIEELMDALIDAGHDFGEVANACCGYNAEISPNIGHALMRDRPATTDRVRERVTDYLGNVSDVDAPRAQALYPIWKKVGDTEKFGNAASVHYLETRYGREVDTRDKYVDAVGPNADVRVQVGNAQPVILTTHSDD